LISKEKFFRASEIWLITFQVVLRFYTTVTQGGEEQGDTGDSLGSRSTGLWYVTHVTLLGGGLGDSREQFLSRMVIRDG